MLGQRVAVTVFLGVPEYEDIARLSADFEISPYESSLATFVVTIQIDKRGPQPLVRCAVDPIEMWAIFLTRRITQHLESLALLVARFRYCCDAAIERVDRRI